jgi:glycosyltransferase involved in cell wall biosynthesis
VQRPVKFVKYLRQFGWEASVLTAANPSVPVFDESLCADLPDDLVIERARTWEPGYAVKQNLAQQAGTARGPAAFLKRLARSGVRAAAGLLLQPDPQILWLPAALRAAQDLLDRLPHDAILATAPPYSSLVLASLLKRRCGLPLVVDYRDEWDLSSQYLENRRRDWLTQVVQEQMQQRVLRRADAIIATTQASAARLQERARRAGSRAAAHCIYNGYDPEDFAPAAAAAAREQATRRFQLVYTGTLWNLTSVEPVVQAIEQLQRETPALLERLEFVCVGRKTPPQQDLLARLAATRCALRNRDYCAHAEVLELMRQADALCLLLTDVPGADRVAPGKLFEYLAARRSILAITPQGETAELVRQFFPRGHFIPSDVPGIAGWLREQLQRYDTAADDVEPAGAADAVARFSRPNLTGQLATLLDHLVS